MDTFPNTGFLAKTICHAVSVRFWFKTKFNPAGILCVFQGDELPYWSKRPTDQMARRFQRTAQVKRERGEFHIHPAVAPVSLLRDYSVCVFTHGPAFILIFKKWLIRRIKPFYMKINMITMQASNRPQGGS